MSKKSLCVILIIAILKSGISKLSVSIIPSKEGDILVLTCILTGKENLTQINWEMIRGSNHTKLGTFHPNFGIHVPSEHSSTVEIDGNQFPKPTSKLFLKNMPLNGSDKVCCQFVMFPSGSLIQCTDVSDASKVNKAGHKMEVTKLSLLGQLGALTVGCILSLLFVSILVYLCQRCFFRRCFRRQVFEIQQDHNTELSTPAQTNTGETNGVQDGSTPSGFDPKKLYAKIKEDLYYGRLWKSYQGSQQKSAQKFQSRQIYFVLGERPLSKKEPEDKATDSNTTSSSLENNT